MKRLSIVALALVCLVDLVSCELTSHVPPPVTAEMANTGKAGRNPSSAHRTSLARLHDGRALFVSRCIECHTLPPVWHYMAGDWPRIVDSMAHRAHLGPSERDAIIAYIIAARAE